MSNAEELTHHQPRKKYKVYFEPNSSLNEIKIPKSTRYLKRKRNLQLNEFHPNIVPLPNSVNPPSHHDRGQVEDESRYQTTSSGDLHGKELRGDESAHEETGSGDFSLDDFRASQTFEKNSNEDSAESDNEISYRGDPNDEYLSESQSSEDESNLEIDTAESDDEISDDIGNDSNDEDLGEFPEADTFEDNRSDTLESDDEVSNGDECVFPDQFKQSL